MKPMRLKGRTTKTAFMNITITVLYRNLLLPEGITTERQRAHYIFKIYRGENLCRGKYMETISSVRPEKDPLNAYVEVFFAGLKV